MDATCHVGGMGQCFLLATRTPPLECVDDYLHIYMQFVIQVEGIDILTDTSSIN